MAGSKSSGMTGGPTSNPPSRPLPSHPLNKANLRQHMQSRALSPSSQHLGDSFGPQIGTCQSVQASIFPPTFPVSGIDTNFQPPSNTILRESLPGLPNATSRAETSPARNDDVACDVVDHNDAHETRRHDEPRQRRARNRRGTSPRRFDYSYSRQTTRGNEGAGHSSYGFEVRIHGHRTFGHSSRHVETNSENQCDSEQSRPEDSRSPGTLRRITQRISRSFSLGEVSRGQALQRVEAGGSHHTRRQSNTQELPRLFRQDATVGQAGRSRPDSRRLFNGSTVNDIAQLDPFRNPSRPSSTRSPVETQTSSDASSGSPHQSPLRAQEVFSPHGSQASTEPPHMRQLLPRDVIGDASVQATNGDQTHNAHESRPRASDQHRNARSSDQRTHHLGVNTAPGLTHQDNAQRRRGERTVADQLHRHSMTPSDAPPSPTHSQWSALVSSVRPSEASGPGQARRTARQHAAPPTVFARYVHHGAARSSALHGLYGEQSRNGNASRSQGRSTLSQLRDGARELNQLFFRESRSSSGNGGSQRERYGTASSRK